MSKDEEKKAPITPQEEEERMRERMEQRKALRAEQKRAELARKEQQEKTKKKIGFAVTAVLGLIVILSLLFLILVGGTI